MVPFSFAGETFVASPEGALFWPAREALLVADLHLEKASWYARLGQFLPPYDSVATLSALTDLVRTSGIRRLYCLGDSFHDRFGCDRLPEQAREMLLALTSTLEWTWILGNHDPGFADHCGGVLIEEAQIGRIILRHEADRADSRPEISGHYHPKYRVNVRGRRVSRRCFVASNTKLILPAFGSLTGGLDASHPEILKQVGPSASALVPLDDRILRFPIAA
ncbi:ligase-associated DNA damage response endonuclease PdeM [Sphingomonas daechungensis]|uniref:Ligase-associated DNA damage response endonuclease PdeM n=1 Tax=Sphingomonas daechungensis TaxID=1176646 RepID=A0ABX6SXL1_9SPHN|nr:ligase-associated DNA damage response endonuclease PdeM [Sphingomonas daechungensis]QNP42334.1 ligase-associated DNA damage response endonuclease PdeM [Sphingomonas daechungensis]